MMIDRQVNDFFDPVLEQLRKRAEFMERKRMQIESRLRNHDYPILERVIRIESLINMTDYASTGANPRDAIIKQAFDVLNDYVGFEYNPSGSFTWGGANKAFNEDVTLIQTDRQLTVNVEGKVEELELGAVNWGTLRRFFYSKWVMARIEATYPGQFKDFYNRLNALFKTKRDPTMPEGRKYIEHATKIAADHLGDFLIQENIHWAFNSKGIWHKGDRRFK